MAADEAKSIGRADDAATEEAESSSKEVGKGIAKTGMAVAAGLVSAHLGGAPGTVLAAGAIPAVEGFIDFVNNLRARRVNQVVKDAAALVEMTEADLLVRLKKDDVRAELAIQVFTAAQDAGTAERLRALSRSLATGAVAEDSASLSVEILYARAVADLGSPHIYVLSLFEKTWSELGLGDYDTLPPSGLNHGQVIEASSLGVALDPVLGVLVQHGLVEERHGSGGATLGGGSSTRGQFSLTDFGQSLLERMTVIGAVDTGGSTDDPEPPSETTEDACLACGAEATHHLFPSSGFVENPDSPEPGTYVPLPLMPLCDDHVSALVSDNLAVGWCGVCNRWGEARRESLCSAPYQPIQG
jgi:hypothetical protein